MDYKEKLIQLLNSNELTKEEEERLCEIFPELAESEDEKIRKALMQNLKERFGTKGNMGEGLDMPDVLTWLEKQGEQKPINEKAVFEVGETITDGTSTFTITDIVDEHYITDVGDKVCFYVAHKYYALIKEQNPVEFQSIEKELNKEWNKCEPKDEGMGLEMANIEHEQFDNIAVHFYNLGLKEQKPVEWSEEDVRNIQDIDSVLFYDKNLPEDTRIRMRNWLKSLSPQNRWKPDSSMLICLEYAIKHINKDGDKRILSKLLEQLKKLREE